MANEGDPHRLPFRVTVATKMGGRTAARGIVGELLSYLQKSLPIPVVPRHVVHWLGHAPLGEKSRIVEKKSGTIVDRKAIHLTIVDTGEHEPGYRVPIGLKVLIRGDKLLQGLGKTRFNERGELESAYRGYIGPCPPKTSSADDHGSPPTANTKSQPSPLVGTARRPSLAVPAHG
jgi:hypothetical protein